MQKQDRLAGTFVDVMDSRTVEIEKAVLDVEELTRNGKRQRYATSPISCAIALGFSREAK